MCFLFQGFGRASAELTTFMIDICRASVDNTDEVGCTALMLASKHGLKDVVGVLSGRTDPNMKNREGLNALMEAASNNCLESAQVLVSSGAYINDMTSNKTNALMLASLKGNSEMVSYLLNQNAAIDEWEHMGDTALILSVQHGQLHTMQVLLESEAAPQIQNSQGLTALMFAAKQNFLEAASLLLRYTPGSQLEVQEHFGETALMLASKHGNGEIVSLLLDNGVNCWTKNSQGFTAKFLANSFGHMLIEEALHTWEKKHPLKPDQNVTLSDMAVTIEEFLGTINLSHLTSFFLENLDMETVGEFRFFNQKKWARVKKQLSSSDFALLGASLDVIGIFS